MVMVNLQTNLMIGFSINRVEVCQKDYVSLDSGKTLYAGFCIIYCYTFFVMEI